MSNTINGRTPDEIKSILEYCIGGSKYCGKCPYISYAACRATLELDALAYIQQLEAREWELFDLLSSAWYGKGYYFKQEDGTVYSRATCKYLTFDQAIDEFASTLTYAQED